jgi:hypothetical protein
VVEASRVRREVITLGAACLLWSGRLEAARAVCLLCLRPGPRDPRNRISQYHLTIIHCLLGEYETAASWGWRALDARPNSPLPHRWLVATLGQLGRPGDAQAIMRRTDELPAQGSFDDHARSRGTMAAGECVCAPAGGAAACRLAGRNAGGGVGACLASAGMCAELRLW